MLNTMVPCVIHKTKLPPYNADDNTIIGRWNVCLVKKTRFLSTTAKAFLLFVRELLEFVVTIASILLYRVEKLSLLVQKVGGSIPGWPSSQKYQN